MQKLGFKRTLLTGLILLIAVCLLVSKTHSYLILKEQTIKSASEHSMDIVSHHAQSLESWFAEKYQAIDTLAQFYQSDQAADNYVQLAKYTNTISDFNAILISLDDGNTYSSLSGDAWVNGVAIIEKYDARTRPWYKQGKRAGGRTEITDVYEDNFTKEKLVSVVKGIDGGVLLGDIELSVLNKTVDAIDYPGAVTAIFDNNGVALVTSSSAIKPGMTLSEVGLSDLEKQMLKSDEAQIDYEVNGSEKVAFTKDIQMVGGQKWHLLIGVDKSIAYAAVDRNLRDSAMSSIVMLLVSAIASFMLLSYLYRPILSLRNMVADLSSGDGDLTKRVPVTSNDDLSKIAEGINEFVSKLQIMMLSIAEASRNIQSSASQLDAMAQENVNVLQNHRQETEQVVTALDEMSATSNDVAGSTSSTAEFTSETAKQSGQSINAVLGVTNTINQLVEKVESTAQQTAQLGEDTSEITNILKVIGEIAEQTNLLALNAAIEAARAGEQGRGFAVVADEVRALASRTQTSTAEIENTLEKLREGVGYTMASMEETKASCNKASQSVDQVSSDLECITNSVQQINGLNIQIAAATEQQSSVAEDVTKNMATISEMADVLARSGDLTTSETLKLVEAEEQLKEVVNQFKLN